MKPITFSLLVTAIVSIAMLCGCADDKLNVVLDNLDRPTYEVADDIAKCYEHLRVTS